LGKIGLKRKYPYWILNSDKFEFRQVRSLDVYTKFRQNLLETATVRSRTERHTEITRFCNLSQAVLYGNQTNIEIIESRNLDAHDVYNGENWDDYSRTILKHDKHTDIIRQFYVHYTSTD